MSTPASGASGARGLETTGGAPGGLERELALEMERWEAAGLRRSLGDDAVGREGVDFTSNDYLSLAGAPELVAAASEALARFGAGGRASRLLGGGCALHDEAERRAAEWLGAEAALLFPSGYQANLGLVGALVDRRDAVFTDALDHASLVDAVRLSRARVFVHAHLDTDELERQLVLSAGARRRLVLAEGVFSMDGDAAPLGRLHELCERHDAWLVVDEAHAAGLLGPAGAGAAAAAGLQDAPRLFARVVTGGKALGVGGAFVAGGRTLREHLIQHARAFVFTTAPSPALAGALCAALELLCSDAGAERRARVLALAAELARALGRPAPAAAIVPWLVGASEAAVTLAGGLRSSGFDVRAVRPPTVPEGSARLRLVCHATNTAAEVDELARRLRAEQPQPAPRTPGRPGALAAAPAAGPASARRASTRRALFVVGTDTGIGKTLVSALLLRAARAAGPAAYWKPVQTGPDSDTETVGLLTRAQPHELLRPAWSLTLPASPHEAAAHEAKRIRPRELEEGLQGLLRTMPETRFVVELAGGLLVPYVADERALVTQADWLAGARARCVLVARSGLGTLNHTLLSLEALRARHLEPEALFLVGDRHRSNRETLRAVAHVPLVLEVPRLERVDAAALEAWLADHDLSALFP